MIYPYPKTHIDKDRAARRLCYLYDFLEPLFFKAWLES